MPDSNITGLEHVDKVVEVNQAPIGRTPRSNPATYTGVFSEIRNLYSRLPESAVRGYKPGRFSFNVKGGRCESYRRLFRAQMDTHMLDEIREALNQELVLGCERFKEKIEKHLGRRTRPAKRGRPQKKNHELQIRGQKDLF